MPRSLARFNPFLAAFGVIGLAVASTSGCGVDNEPLTLPGPGSHQLPIVNGARTQEYAAVGIISAGGSLCTATLIGKHAVITAAHCVTPGRKHYFIAGNRHYVSTSVEQHPQYHPNYAENDLAVVLLADAPTIRPAGISTRPPAKGQKLTLVGYGATSSSGSGSGTKRVGYNTVAHLSSTRIFIAGAGGELGNLCFGDSGGPTFAELGDHELQVGVHSTIAGDCGVQGHDMRLDVYADWISQATGGDVSVDGQLSPLFDTEPPRVTITSPVHGDEVPWRLAVTALVEDNEAVVSASLAVDGELVATLEHAGPDFSFHAVELAPGVRRLTVVGLDVAGNQGEQSVAVVVAEPIVFGLPCETSDACHSGLCVHHGTAGQYCSQLCDPAGDPCPADAICMEASGGKHACGPPPALLLATRDHPDTPAQPASGLGEGTDATTTSSDGSSGCAMGAAPSTPDRRGRFTLPALLLLLGVSHLGRRSRPSRRRSG